MALRVMKSTLQEALIEEIQIHPSIWDLTSSVYKNLFVKGNSWNTVLRNMKSHFSGENLIRHKMSSEEELKKAWRYLRDQYSKAKRTAKANAKSGVGLDDVQAETYCPFFARVIILFIASLRRTLVNEVTQVGGWGRSLF